MTITLKGLTAIKFLVYDSQTSERIEGVYCYDAIGGGYTDSEGYTEYFQREAGVDTYWTFEKSGYQTKDRYWVKPPTYSMTFSVRLDPVGIPEGVGHIPTIDLPVELDAGAWITGEITIRNDGEADGLALVFKTEWDGKLFGTNFGRIIFSPGQTGGAVLSEGMVAMPGEDATITVYGCHQQAGGEFIIGNIPYKIDETKRH